MDWRWISYSSISSQSTQVATGREPLTNCSMSSKANTLVGWGNLQKKQRKYLDILGQLLKYLDSIIGIRILDKKCVILCSCFSDQISTTNPAWRLCLQFARRAHRSAKMQWYKSSGSTPAWTGRALYRMPSKMTRWQTHVAIGDHQKQQKNGDEWYQVVFFFH